MKSLLRPPALGEVIRKMTTAEKRRDVVVDPEGGLFGVKNLATAIKRSARGDVIHIPSGEYPAFELSKVLELRSLQSGPVRITGTLRIRTEAQIVLSGLILQAEPGARAIEVLKGTLFLDDCTVHGEIGVGSPEGKAEFFARNCLLGNAVVGVDLTDQAAVEIQTSRLTGCRVGLSLQAGTTAAVYDSRIEACLSVEESDPGAGLSAENATVYFEGVTFSRNTIGAYLKNCTDARFLSSHFHANETASLIAAHDPSSTPLQLHSCSFDGQTTSRCAQISLTGGAAVLARTKVALSPAPALSLDQTRVELRDSSLASCGEPALDARSAHITAKGLTAISQKSAGFAAVSCQGILRESLFVGEPPTAIGNSLQLILESCTSRDALPEAEAVETEEAPASTITEVMQKLQTSVSQEVVRNELERILRLAHAGQQRQLGGLPVPNQSYHSIFMGPSGTGKLTAARLLAEGLHAFGVLPSAEVEELSLSNVNGAHHPHPGIVFVRAHEATGSEGGNESARQAIERLVSIPGEIVVLDGERDELRRLLRQSAVLDRAFRHTVYFTSFGPLELAALFTQLCDRDRIPVSVEAMRTILLAFHLYCERRDRRYANAHGVETLYENTRRRYLERCSVAQRVDLELEPRDMEIPQDKSLLTALERSPAFVSFCPACTRENAWLPGLEAQVQCLHCDACYTANWGVWKDSATYRRMKETLSRAATPDTSLIPRASLPPVH
jgi:hypothetical protein